LHDLAAKTWNQYILKHQGDLDNIYESTAGKNANAIYIEISTSGRSFFFRWIVCNLLRWTYWI